MNAICRACVLGLLVLIVGETRLFAGTVAIYSFGSGWATFGLALPQGSAIGGVRVGSLSTQTDVKTTWPDGSIRFAIVTANIPVAGDYAIDSAEASTDTLAVTWPTADVRFTIGGQTYIAEL